MAFLVDPLISFDIIDRAEMNRHLIAWGHQMGPIERPIFKAPVDFALRENGEAIAVIAADTLIRPTCNFTRSDAFELSRLCAVPERHGLCSMAMKMWRVFAYPHIARAWKTPWVISYQDATRHKGTLYRFDHWLVAGYSSGGGDPRAAPVTVTARRRKIWAWNADTEAMAARRKEPIIVPAWDEKAAA